MTRRCWWLLCWSAVTVMAGGCPTCATTTPCDSAVDCPVGFRCATQGHFCYRPRWAGAPDGGRRHEAGPGDRVRSDTAVDLDRSSDHGVAGDAFSPDQATTPDHTITPDVTTVTDQATTPDHTITPDVTSASDATTAPDLGPDDLSADRTAALMCEDRPTGELYRSVGPGQSSALAFNRPDSPLANVLHLDKCNASFDRALPGDVGVGDVLIYGSTGQQILFIHHRRGPTQFTVANADGTSPVVSAPSIPIWQIFRAYTSLNDASSQDENEGIPEGVRDFDTSKDLVGLQERLNIACYAGNGPDLDVEVAGWTTSQTHHLLVFTPYLDRHSGVRQRHRGVWSTDYYHIKGSSAGSVALTVDSSNVAIEGLQVAISLPNSHDTNVVHLHGDSILFSHSLVTMLVGGLGPAGTRTGILAEGAGIGIFDNFIFGLDTDLEGHDDSACIRMNRGGATNHYLNNSVVGCYRGFKVSNGTARIKNNIAQRCNALDCYDGIFEGAEANLSSYDEGATATEAVVDFQNPAGGDLHLTSNNAKAIDQGVHLGAPTLPWGFDDDIDGDPRGTTAWDIGADEYRL